MPGAGVVNRRLTLPLADLADRGDRGGGESCLCLADLGVAPLCPRRGAFHARALRPRVGTWPGSGIRGRRGHLAPPCPCHGGPSDLVVWFALVMDLSSNQSGEASHIGSIGRLGSRGEGGAAWPKLTAFFGNAGRPRHRTGAGDNHFSHRGSSSHVSELTSACWLVGNSCTLPPLASGAPALMHDAHRILGQRRPATTSNGRRR